MAKDKVDSPKGGGTHDEDVKAGTLGEVLSELSEEEITKRDTAEEYHLNKNRFLQVVCSETKDELAGHYTIHTNEPLKQWDKPLAKAYAVTDKRTKDKTACYALVLDKRYPIRLAAINKVLGRQQNNFSNIMAAGVIPLSLGKGRFYTLILQKPAGITLREYIRKNGAIREAVIIDHIVPAINGVLKFLSSQGVVHGCINPDMIYVGEHGEIMVDECVSSPCGAHQFALYEHIDRATALPMGRGGGDIVTDFYALGVLVAFMSSGRDPSQGMALADLLEAKFIPGTYHFITKDSIMPMRILDLLRGVVNEKKSEVWNSQQVGEWIHGRRFNLLPPASHIEASRPIVFNEKKYQNKKYLAHGLFMNWDKAKRFCRDDTLLRWVERSAQDNDLADRLSLVAARVGAEMIGDFDRDDEVLTQYILLLDPQGPIRVKEFAANIDGMGPLMAQGYAENKQDYLAIIEDILGHNLVSLWGELRAGGVEDSVLQEYIFALEKADSLSRKNDIGFGMERCLYELNPTLPCQSSMLLEDCVFTTVELLKFLEKKDSLADQIIDKQIGGFLANRIELPRRIRITSLARFPDFANNEYVQTLAMLAHAQQVSRVERLPDLSHKVLDSLKKLIKTFHSKYIKAELEKNLEKTSKQGSLMNMLATLSDNKYLVRDRVGFSRATKKYKHNAIQILKLSNQKAITNIGYRYGLQLSVMLSFIVATIVFVVLMMKFF